MRASVAFVLAFSAVMGGPGSGMGQQYIDGTRPSCEACVVRQGLVVTFGETGPGVGFPSTLVRLNDGQYVFSNIQIGPRHPAHR